MRRILGLIMLIVLTLVFGPAACDSSAADKDKGKGKGIVVDLDGLQSTTPADWKEEAPSNRMRLTQFRLPKKSGDKDDAQLVVFQKLGGGSKANVERWKKQFLPPEGKKIDDVSEVKEIKIGDRPATYLDVRGDYMFNPQPFNPRSKTVRKPGYRMLAIYFDGPKEIYQIKLTGPAKTIEAYKKDFDEWVKNFK